jgi:hypothetical protein
MITNYSEIQLDCLLCINLAGPQHVLHITREAAAKPGNSGDHPRRDCHPFPATLNLPSLDSPSSPRVPTTPVARRPGAAGLPVPLFTPSETLEAHHSRPCPITSRAARRSPPARAHPQTCYPRRPRRAGTSGRSSGAGRDGHAEELSRQQRGLGLRATGVESPAEAGAVRIPRRWRHRGRGRGR